MKLSSIREAVRWIMEVQGLSLHDAVLTLAYFDWNIDAVRENWHMHCNPHLYGED